VVETGNCLRKRSPGSAGTLREGAWAQHLHKLRQQSSIQATMGCISECHGESAGRRWGSACDNALEGPSSCVRHTAAAANVNADAVETTNALRCMHGRFQSSLAREEARMTGQCRADGGMKQRRSPMHRKATHNSWGCVWLQHRGKHHKNEHGGEHQHGEQSRSNMVRQKVGEHRGAVSGDAAAPHGRTGWATDGTVAGEKYDTRPHTPKLCMRARAAACAIV
jgi:hypothetical protein